MAEEAGDFLGTVYSSDVTTLRIFGAAYLSNRQPVGSLTLFDPVGRPVEQLDMLSGRWKGIKGTAFA